MLALRRIHWPDNKAADSLPLANGNRKGLDWQVYQTFKWAYMLRRKKTQITKEGAAMLVRNQLELESESIKKLLEKYEEEEICDSLRRLQHEGVFRCEDIAARRFSEPPPATDAPIPEHVRYKEAEEQEEAESSNSTGGPPSVTSVDIPFGAQYKLLVHVQGCLERACYNYGQKNMPEEALLRQGWDCAEAVTLDTWIEQNPNLQVTPKPDDKDNVSESTIQAIVDIPRRAVARTRTTSAKLEGLLRGAEDYIEMLEDKVHFRAIQGLRHDVRLAIEDLRQSECRLQDQLKESLSRIAKQRARLDHEEQIIISRAKMERKLYQARAGSKIKSAVERSNEVQLANDISDGDWDDGNSQTMTHEE